MTSLEWGRLAAFGVGGFQILTNFITLFRGPIRIRQELTAETLSERFADLLSVAFVYGSIANLCISGLLILLASEIRRGNPVALRVVLAIGLYYVTVGIATFSFGIRRHWGLLVFTILGILLVCPLILHWRRNGL